MALPVTFVAGEVLEASQLNSNFTYLDAAPQVAIFNESQASGTNGGTFTSGSFVKRVLNTTVVNNITSCTLTSSVISLPAGSYEVFATAPAHFCDFHKTQLQNTTASTTIAQGSSEISAAGGSGVQTISVLQTFFTLTATTNIELQHRCHTTKATNGLGVPSSFSVDEIYAQITITKVA